MLVKLLHLLLILFTSYRVIYVEESTARAKTDVNTWDHAVARRSGLGGRGVHFPRGLIRMNLGSGRNSSELTIFFRFPNTEKLLKEIRGKVELQDNLNVG